MIEEKDSILPVIHFETGDEWSEVLHVSEPHLDARGVNRLRPVLEGIVKTVAVERHYIDKDYRDTFSYYHSKRFRTPDSRCIRLHFFSEKIHKDELHDSNRAPEAYLGYSVIRPTRPNCVGRTLLRPPLKLVKNAHIRLCSEKVNLQGLLLEVEGFPFISQDADVTVCAQSALWVTLRYFSNRYDRYGEIHPYQISALTTDYSLGRLFPSEGLTVWQMAEALRRHRFEPLIYSRERHKDQFEHLLYTYIESGIPCLIGFNDHVVSGFGHRSELDASIIPNDGGTHFSSRFNQGFVICDDNYFPYQSLNRNGEAEPLDSRYRFSDIHTFIAPLPDKVFLTAEGFEQQVKEVTAKFFSPRKAPLDQTLVCRLLLTTGSSFKSKLSLRGMGHPLVQRLYRELPLPHFIWVCEISTPEDYAKGKIWGEILWDATFNPHEIEGLIAFHLPDNLFIDVGGPLNRPQSLKKLDLPDSRAYDLYVNNLKNLN